MAGLNLRRMARPAPSPGRTERVVLERTAQAEKLPSQDVQRARIVLYAANGVSDIELDTTAGLVGRLRRRFDRGSQFRTGKLVGALNRHDMVGSMGRVGSAGDKAAMESFFSLLQKNVPDRLPGPRQDLRIAIVTWIERTYRSRRPCRLCARSPRRGHRCS